MVTRELYDWRQACFVRLRLRCRLLEPACIDAAVLMRLRRRLRQAGQQLFGGTPAATAERFAALFEAPVALNPAEQRRAYRAGAPFVLQPCATPPLAGVAGATFDSEVLLWGQAALRLADWLALWQQLGQQGLSLAGGRFEPVCLDAADASGHFVPLWQLGASSAVLPPAPQCDLAWWLALQSLDAPLLLRLETPARLLSRGRPLFRADFIQFFPFILRRVSALLAAHCGLPFTGDAARLCQLAGQVKQAGCLRWHDWRLLTAAAADPQPLGGLLGQLKLDGSQQREVIEVVAVGSLLNLGKNAACGAGAYRLLPVTASN